MTLDFFFDLDFLFTKKCIWEQRIGYVNSRLSMWMVHSLIMHCLAKKQNNIQIKKKNLQIFFSIFFFLSLKDELCFYALRFFSLIFGCGDICFWKISKRWYSFNCHIRYSSCYIWQLNHAIFKSGGRPCHPGGRLWEGRRGSNGWVPGHIWVIKKRNSYYSISWKPAWNSKEKSMLMKKRSILIIFIFSSQRINMFRKEKWK